MGEAFITRRGSSGGGGPTSSDAILRVTVPTGSIVTATKGGVTLTPTMWVQAADNTLDCALFVIQPSLFDTQNAWTVSATLNRISKTQTVLINSNEEYQLSFNLYVPDGYTPIEYIQSSGTQYLETSWYPTSNSKFVTNIYADSQHDKNIIGTRTNVAGERWILYVDSSSKLAVGYGTQTLDTLPISTIFNSNKHEIVYDRNKFYVDGVLKYSFTTESFSVNSKFGFFTFNGLYAFTGRSYRTFGYDSDIMTHIWEPCYRNSDSVIGMYDSYALEFLTNKGSGSFTAGPNVS